MSDEQKEEPGVLVPKKDYEKMWRQAEAYKYMLAIGQAQRGLAQIEKELVELAQSETGNL